MRVMEKIMGFMSQVGANIVTGSGKALLGTIFNRYTLGAAAIAVSTTMLANGIPASEALGKVLGVTFDGVATAATTVAPFAWDQAVEHVPDLLASVWDAGLETSAATTLAM